VASPVEASIEGYASKSALPGSSYFDPIVGFVLAVTYHQ
jgi:hypothetical protein